MKAAICRFLLIIGMITVIPYFLFWVITGMNWIDIMDEIDWM